MALAHQILMSAEYPAVTNARANGDGGLAVDALVLTSVLASQVGLGWSKDNLRTASKCYVDGLYPNGTVEWPCGSVNQGEGTSGSYTMQVQQTVLATMSLGPVGLADQLTSYPSNASADITSNKTLVMATCTTNGTLLQPSYPLTPIDSMMIGAGDFGDCFTPERHVAYTYGCGGHIWATYTAVDMPAPTLPPLRQPAPPFAATATAAAAPSAAPSAAASGVWYTAIGWVAGRTKPKAAAIDLYESDLASMVDGGAADGAAATSPSFSTIPVQSFSGAGASFAAGTEHVVWAADFLVQKDCSTVTVAAWTGKVAMDISQYGGGLHSDKPKSGGDGVVMINVAPVFNGVALLGEVGKVTSVSTHRFASVAPTSSPPSPSPSPSSHSPSPSPTATGITVGLQGKPAEVVVLFYATGSSAEGYKCATQSVTIGGDGTASTLLH